MRDAVNARQALADDGAADGLRWLVAGEIEELEGADALIERIRRH